MDRAGEQIRFLGNTFIRLKQYADAIDEYSLFILFADPKEDRGLIETAQSKIAIYQKKL